MIPPIQPQPPSQPYNKPLRQRVGDVANTALNVFSVGFGLPFGAFIVHCMAEDAKMVKPRGWLA